MKLIYAKGAALALLSLGATAATVLPQKASSPRSSVVSGGGANVAGPLTPPKAKVPIPIVSDPKISSDTAPKHQHPIRVKVLGGVMSAMVHHKVNPTYPQTAIDERVQGAVVLHALISKGGTPTELLPISGPMELRDAATDAVSQWTYSPYLLDGEPVGVDTTITVMFTLQH